MEEKKKSNAGLIVLVVILLLACVGMGAFIFINKDKLTSEVKTTSSQGKETNNVNTSDNKKETLEGQFYLFEGFSTNRRYYLAYDNSDKLGEDNTFIDGRKMNVYLVDMNLSNTNEFIKKIDLASLIQGVYDEKINSLPDVLAAGTVNETKKADCKEYKIQYTTSEASMIDGKKEVPFGIYYACIHDYQGGKAELSLGTEYYKLDVDSMKVTK